jgi:hypothetical protein
MSDPLAGGRVTPDELHVSLTDVAERHRPIDLQDPCFWRGIGGSLALMLLQNGTDSLASHNRHPGLSGLTPAGR